MTVLGVKSNAASLVAQAAMQKASSDASASINRLSTGNRLDKAGTDIIALTIGESLKASKVTLEAVLRNSQQADSMLSVGDTGLQQSNDLLLQMKELAVTAAGPLTEAQRQALSIQFESIKDEVNRIAKNTDFNGVELLNGAYGGAIVGLGGALDANGAYTVDQATQANGGKGGIATMSIIGIGNQVLDFVIDATAAAVPVAGAPGAAATFNFQAQSGIVSSAAAVENAGQITTDNLNAYTQELTTGLNTLFGSSRVDLKVTAGTAGNTDSSIEFTLDGALKSEVSIVAAPGGGAGFVYQFKTTNLETEQNLTLEVDASTQAKLSGNINFITAAQSAADDLNIATVEMLAGETSTDTIQIQFANARVQNLFRSENVKYDTTLTGPSINTSQGAKEAMSEITDAIDNLSIMEAKIGVSQRRLTTIQTILEDTIVAQESTRSNYQDTNYIVEPSKLASANTRFDAGRQSLAAEMQQRFRAISSLIQAAAQG